MILGNNTGVGDYAITQTVSSLRLNGLNVRYQLPPALASRFKASSGAISLQGSNLRLWSNYSGLDPSMNALVNELDGSRDLGGVPKPRTWRFELNLAY
jgi:hypothetical protein